MHNDPFPAPPDECLLIFQPFKLDLNDFLTNLTGLMFIKNWCSPFNVHYITYKSVNQDVVCS